MQNVVETIIATFCFWLESKNYCILYIAVFQIIQDLNTILLLIFVIKYFIEIDNYWIKYILFWCNLCYAN